MHSQLKLDFEDQENLFWSDTDNLSQKWEHEFSYISTLMNIFPGDLEWGTIGILDVNAFFRLKFNFFEKTKKAELYKIQQVVLKNIFIHFGL